MYVKQMQLFSGAREYHQNKLLQKHLDPIPHRIIEIE